jgi:hypothetical protein
MRNKARLKAAAEWTASHGSLPISSMIFLQRVRTQSAFGGIVLQNYFELPSEEIFFKIAPPVRNIDSRNRPFGFYSCPISFDPRSWASFATQSGAKRKTSAHVETYDIDPKAT